MKMMLGASCAAFLNNSRHFASVSPTADVVSEVPSILKNFISVPVMFEISFASALARWVFPVPGGPASITPLFIVCPRSSLYTSGNTISSSNWVMAFLCPATSEKFGCKFPPCIIYLSGVVTLVFMIDSESFSTSVSALS